MIPERADLRGPFWLHGAHAQSPRSWSGHHANEERVQMMGLVGGAHDLSLRKGVRVMRKQNCLSMAVAIVAALAVGSAVWAANSTATTITISDLECQGCAKKVTAKLKEVAGVTAVEASVEAKTATVTPKPQTALSPRALWEAVEKAGKQPIKLQGPSGTFTAKS